MYLGNTPLRLLFCYFEECHRLLLSERYLNKVMSTENTDAPNMYTQAGVRLISRPDAQSTKSCKGIPMKNAATA